MAIANDENRCFMAMPPDRGDWFLATDRTAIVGFRLRL
jgi:hypothetical protein